MAHVALVSWTEGQSFVLVTIHSTGKFDQTPTLLLLNLVALITLGIWARVCASRTMAVSTPAPASPAALRIAG